MKKFLAILVNKIIRAVGGAMNRGSSLPGKTALRIDPNILNKIEYPKELIVVTGTTGKTSSTQMISEIYRAAGKKVATNPEGANLLWGVTTAILSSVSLTGKSKVDALALEIDERYIKRAFKFFTPTRFCITNISRDQLARNGHYELVFKELESSIKDDSMLFINADSSKMKGLTLKHDGKVRTFGICEHEGIMKESRTSYYDEAYCPNCHHMLEYEYYHYGEFGCYHCLNCGFERSKADYDVTEVNLDEKYFVINGKTKIRMPNDVFYNIYNELVAYSICKECGIDEKTIVKSLESFKQASQRYRKFDFEDRPIYIMTTKNETPLSYNTSIDNIIAAPGKKTAMFGFEEIGRHYSMRDLSWIWDVNFEGLKDADLDHIVIIGPFASQLRARMTHAGLDPEKMIVEEDSSKALEALRRTGKNPIYAALYFDSEEKLVELLDKEA